MKGARHFAVHAGTAIGTLKQIDWLKRHTAIRFNQSAEKNPIVDSIMRCEKADDSSAAV